MKRIRCYVKVAKYCLLETVQTLYEQGAKELAIGKEDYDWLVSFDKTNEQERNNLEKRHSEPLED